MPDHDEKQPLVEAYRATTYVGMPDDGPDWCLRIGESSPVDGPMAYITSDNPGSQRRSNTENERQRSVLHAELANSSYELTPAKSVADDGEWPDEYGFWVQPIDRETAVEIARKYQQNAIVFVDDHGEIELVFC